MDRSIDDSMSKWFFLSLDVKGSGHMALARFHHDSQGFDHLDRVLGSLMCSPANLAHPMFGVQFAAYVEFCHSEGVAPRGRVMIAMVSLRFRIDRNQGKNLNILHLFTQSPTSFKMEHMKDFLNRLRLVLTNLKSDQIKESCGVRKKAQRFDRRLSEGSTKSLGVTLASGRVCHRLSEDARRVSPVSDMHRSHVSGCDIPRDCVGELESDMRDLARLFEVSDRPQLDKVLPVRNALSLLSSSSEVTDVAIGESMPRRHVRL